MYADGMKKFETAISLWMEALEVSGSTIKGCDALSCRVRWVARVRVGVWCVAGRTAAVCARVRVCGCRARGVRAPVCVVCVCGGSVHLGCLREVGRHGGLGH